MLVEWLKASIARWNRAELIDSWIMSLPNSAKDNKDVEDQPPARLRRINPVLKKRYVSHLLFDLPNRPPTSAPPGVKDHVYSPTPGLPNSHARHPKASTNMTFTGNYFSSISKRLMTSASFAFKASSSAIFFCCARISCC